MFYLLTSSFVFAAEGALDMRSLAAGFAIAIAIFAAAMAQGKAAAAAFEGMSRNPSAGNRIFIAMLLALALIESLALLAFVISNSLLK